MSSEPPAQFDGIYKFSLVFGSVLELNESPAQFPLSWKMSTILGIILRATTRKWNASDATFQPTFYNFSFLLVGQWTLIQQSPLDMCLFYLIIKINKSSITVILDQSWS